MLFMKTNNLIWALALCVSPAFTSCSNDDDNGGGSGKPVETFDGYLLTRVGEYSFSYDEKGRCTTVWDNGDPEMEFNYNSGTLMTEDESGKVRFNGSGYINEISGSYTEKDEDDGTVEKSSGSFTFSYNSNGNLVSVKGESKGSVSGRYGYSWSDNFQETYTWTNGNLVKVKCLWTSVEDGEKWSDTYEADVTYGTETNKYRQYTYMLADEGILYNFDGEFEALALVGLFGKGTAEYPQTISYSWSEFDSDGTTNSGSGSYRSTITTNTFDAISTERVAPMSGSWYSTYYYEYEPASDWVMSKSMSQSLMSLKKLFKHKSRRHLHE